MRHRPCVVCGSWAFENKSLGIPLVKQVSSTPQSSKLLRVLSFWLGSIGCAITGYAAAELHPGIAAGIALVSLFVFCAVRLHALAGVASIIRVGASVALVAWSSDPAVQTLSSPKTFPAVFALSGFAAAVTAMAILGCELISLPRRHRGLRFAELLSLLSPGYLLGALLLLSSPILYTTPFGASIASLFGSALGALVSPVVLRSLVVIACNLLIAALMSGITVRHVVWDTKLNLLLVASAVFAAATPEIADLGARFSPGFPLIIQAVFVIAAVAIAQAGLWAQTYLITGLFLQAIRGIAPSSAWGNLHYRQGLWRGLMYSIVFMACVQAVYVFAATPHLDLLFGPLLIPTCAVLGTILFPILKTIVESFDGSAPFMQRLNNSFRDSTSYWRGAVVGCGVGLLFSYGIQDADPWTRFLLGALIGALGFGGINMVQDASEIIRNKREQLQVWNVYAVQALLGSIAGGALCWYADSRQLETVTSKFLRYASATVGTKDQYVIYPLFSKFGATDLGYITGGARLLYNESLSGVVNWSLAAPLFSINLVLLSSLLYKRVRPIREMFTTAGLIDVVEQTLRVERWGLWMAPIIYSFLRMAPEPSWYNQDGAVRTMLATYNSLTLDPVGFKTWSLSLFVSMLAYDWLRVLLWFDHMGLRVATLVNLSFVGGDVLDNKASVAMGHPTPTRVIPEGLRRFGTWMPLLLPFYLPRGADWDYAWGTAETINKQAAINGLPPALWLCAFVAIAGTVAAIAQIIRWPSTWNILYSWSEKIWTISNGRYTVLLDPSGRGWSRVTRRPGPSEEVDLTRRPDDPASLIGKFFYLHETDADGNLNVWSLHNRPVPRADGHYECERLADSTIRYTCRVDHIETEAFVSLEQTEPIERWKVKLTNHSQTKRKITMISYRELVCQASHAVQRQMGYNDLHLQMCYIEKLQVLLGSNRLLRSWDGRPSKETYFHTVAPLPKEAKLIGYEDSRLSFFGTGSEWKPLGLQLGPRPVSDEGVLYPFDPAASLWVEVDLEPGASVNLEFIEGFAEHQWATAALLGRMFNLPGDLNETVNAAFCKERSLERRHLPPEDAPIPWSFSEDGTEVHVAHNLPRAWAHPVANAAGYGFVATNEGAFFSFASNAQQNAITPFILGHHSGGVPGQALYIWNCEDDAPVLRMPRRLEQSFNGDSGNWETHFGRGYVRFEIEKPEVKVEVTAFVFADHPIEGRLFTLTNTTDKPQTLRIAPYYQVILAEIAADSRGELKARWDETLKAFIIENPRQHFRRGPFFLAASFTPETTQTIRNRFVGAEQNMRMPQMARFGRECSTCRDDGARVAALTYKLTLAPGETTSLSLIMGQAQQFEQIEPWIKEFNSPAAVSAELTRATQRWDELLSVIRVTTEEPAFDRMVNDWLPYQILSSRLWGRTGQHQRSGAYGFRDQLQDVIPLASLHPEISRRQILLHAAQQFREGDALQWWHQTWEGKTGLGARNRASDIPLWLPHVLLRYLKATGDHQILNAPVGFLEGEEIPASAEGICFIPRTAQESATLYQHCLLAINRSLSQLGNRGIPLMGSCDWNDGLDGVGRHGHGESIWLGFFLYSVLNEFLPIIRERDGQLATAPYSAAAEQLKHDLEPMWRGTHYVRATMDDGRELIYDDALTTAWPIIARAVDRQRGEIAMNHGLSKLEKDHLVLLLNPPFHAESDPYPGRIAIYPPGVRENGGQYSHGSSWLVDALMVLAQQAADRNDDAAATQWRARAGVIWEKISPLTHAGADQWAWYGLAPHQQPADVYAGSGHDGCGGWSWYTGSAGRMLTAAWELLGLHVIDGKVTLADWATDGSTWPKLKQVSHRGTPLL